MRKTYFGTNPAVKKIKKSFPSKNENDLLKAFKTPCHEFLN